MNLTTECPNQSSNTCAVSCQDPTQSNQCILLTALLIDGSPCGQFPPSFYFSPNGITGYGGICASGKCQSNGLFSTAKVIVIPPLHQRAYSPHRPYVHQAWFTQNLQIAIPVAVVAGLVAVLILWFLGRGAFRLPHRPAETKPPLFFNSFVGMLSGTTRLPHQSYDGTHGSGPTDAAPGELRWSSYGIWSSCGIWSWVRGTTFFWSR